MGIESSLRNLKAVCNLYEECRNLPSWPNRDVYIPAYGQNIHMIGGFPEAGTLSRVGEIHDLIDPTGFDLTTPDGSRTQWSIPDTEDCYVQYKQIGGGETFPVIELVSSGC